MKSILVILLLFIANQTWAQVDSIPQVKKDIDFLKQLDTPDANTGAKVKIHGDSRIAKLLKLNQSVNKKTSSFQGYRIKILSRSSYNTNIDSLKSFTLRFMDEYPDIPAYLQYIDPDFKIRAGNYRTRIETLPALKRIRKKYPTSYPVKTVIYMNELNPVQKQDTIIPVQNPVEL